MEELEFEPIKTTKEFRENYILHDCAYVIIELILDELSISYIHFGEDMRDKRVWAKGKDKPDYYIESPLCYMDIKGHRGRTFILNKRAYDSYIWWGEKTSGGSYCVWIVNPESLLEYSNPLDNHILSAIYYSKLPFRAFEIKDYSHHDGNKKVIECKKVEPFSNFLKLLNWYRS